MVIHDFEPSLVRKCMLSFRSDDSFLMGLALFDKDGKELVKTGKFQDGDYRSTI